MLTLDQLVVLKTIIESGSFRAASEILHKAQSAISYAVRNLESELGVQLFDRSSYRPTLTMAGKAIYEKSQSVLLQMQELESLGQHLSQGHESRLKLAINGICPFQNIIDTINGFSHDFPSVNIVLSVENLGGAVERLLYEDADIALSEVTEWQDQIEGILWDRIEFIPVASPEYPASLSNVPLTKSDMLQYTQIVVADSAKKLKPKTVGVLSKSNHWTVNDFTIKKQLLLSGCGWGLMPKHMVENELSKSELVAISYKPMINLQIDFYLLRRKDCHFGPMAKQLWELLKAISRLDNH